jgi:putative CocE/NonD family hydrolase
MKSLGRHSRELSNNNLRLSAFAIHLYDALCSLLPQKVGTTLTQKRGKISNPHRTLDRRKYRNHLKLTELTFWTRVFGYLSHLPKALTHDVVVERKIPVKMPDGVELLADHYFARKGGEKEPIILVRCPYGRDSVWGLTARSVAERGYQVFIQSVRGTFGSGGEFDPEINEASDGIATLNWLKEQKWFSGRVAMTGPSYLGYVQWAIATNSPPEYLKAIVPSITASQFRSVTYPGGSLALDTFLSWVYLVHRQEKLGTIQRVFSQLGVQRTLKPAFDHIPLNEADQLVLGERSRIFQDTIANEVDRTKFWDARDHSIKVKYVKIPTHLICGWYDIFLPSQLDDYLSLKASGKITPFLTIGPWSHENYSGLFEGVRESLEWFDKYLREDESKVRRDPVKLFILGCKQWITLSEWPPPQMKQTRWYLHEGKVLDPNSPTGSTSAFDAYDYDPKDPTPAVGGVVIGMNAGPKDNRKLEARADVLTYTSPQFEQDYTIIGPVSVELYVQSSTEYTDFFGRICDISPNGKSTNISDNLLRLSPTDFEKNRGPDGVVKITFDLWPTACCFQKSHRMGLQVSSGSHPRFARNLGSGEPIATAKNFVVAHQKVFHDALHPSSVSVPVFETNS